MDHHLTPYLKQLRLSGILETLEVRNQQAIGEQWTYLDFLTRLLQDEVERRGQKQLALRVRRSGIATAKTLESFDFLFNPSISRQQLYDLATCSFIREHRNVLICGQTGVGKSHLGHALAHEAARKGFDILFTSAHQMLLHINAGRADGSYEKRLAAYTKPHLLVIDDFGLKPLPPSGPADLYDVINERYERASIVLTSNRAPSEWPDLFSDPLLASAGLDRLAHRAIVLMISGRSYRLARRDEGEEVALFTQAP
jgi:DNA replication protein DnaC